MVVACFIKEIQLRAELLRMSDMGLIPAATVQVGRGMACQHVGQRRVNFYTPMLNANFFFWWQIDNDTVPTLNTTRSKLLTAGSRLRLMILSPGPDQGQV